MFLIKQIIVGWVLMLCVSFSYGQIDSLSRGPISTDTVMKAPLDTFNYVFPPKDRPHKLLELLLDNIRERSSNTPSLLRSLQEQSHLANESVQGRMKSERPLWILLTVFLLFLAVAIIRLVFPADFMLIILAFYQERTLQQVSKEDNMLTSWPYVFLYVIFSLAFGLFVVLMESAFVRQELLRVDNYLETSFVVGLLFVLKILVIRFISFVFELHRLVREYIAVLYLVYFNSMLFLMPFLLITVFVPATYFKWILVVFSIVISILFVYRLLRTAVRLFGNLKFSLIYLILYLCALEVAPILILIKVLGR